MTASHYVEDTDGFDVISLIFAFLVEVVVIKPFFAYSTFGEFYQMHRDWIGLVGGALYAAGRAIFTATLNAIQALGCGRQAVVTAIIMVHSHERLLCAGDAIVFGSVSLVLLYRLQSHGYGLTPESIAWGTVASSIIGALLGVGHYRLVQMVIRNQPQSGDQPS